MNTMWLGAISLVLMHLLVSRERHMLRIDEAMLAAHADLKAEWSRKVVLTEERVEAIVAERVELTLGASVPEPVQSSVFEDMAARTDTLESTLAELQHTLQQYHDTPAPTQSTRPRLQGWEPEPEPEPEQGEVARIIKPVTETVRCGGPGTTTSNGHFDSSRCEEPAFALCHQEACDEGSKGRRTQSVRACKPSDLERRITEINSRCCDEADEDCGQGYPSVCNTGCAEVFLPFMAECQSALGGSSQFEPAVALCEATSAPSLAEQLNVRCTDGTVDGDCVPTCSDKYHGFLMLLNIDGDDTKLSCELQHGLYSWLGAAVRFT